MRYVECRTQADLDAVKSPNVAVVRNGSFTAYGSSQVRACDSSQVTASPLVAVTRSGKHARVDGGVLIDIPDLGSVESWAEDGDRIEVVA